MRDVTQFFNSLSVDLKLLPHEKLVKLFIFQIDSKIFGSFLIVRKKIVFVFFEYEKNTVSELSI